MADPIHIRHAYWIHDATRLAIVSLGGPGAPDGDGHFVILLDPGQTCAGYEALQQRQILAGPLYDSEHAHAVLDIFKEQTARQAERLAALTARREETHG